MENIPASLFKAYDIRGLSPEHINAAFAKRLGKAIAAQMHPKKVLVGRDMRTTSFPLESALIEGLTSSGVNVVRIGLCSTPLFNATMGLARGEYDLGVMITASHNPGKYNGFKLMRGDGMPIGNGSGMEELRDAFIAEKGRATDQVGTVIDDATALDRYIDLVLQLADLPADMPRMKVAIDAGNGVAGAILPRLLSRLPWIDAVPLYFELDGTFPNHQANPLKTETLSDLTRAVLDNGCVAGVAFDGDADRVGFMDERGVSLGGDLLTAFFAEEILYKNQGGLILYTVTCSWVVPEVTTAIGGRAEMCPVGHSSITKRMQETGAVFGGETSMHFFFKELWNCESGDLAMLLLLKRLFREQKPLSELWKPLRRYVRSGEINFQMVDSRAVVKMLKEKYAPQAFLVSELDGIRLEFRHTDAPDEDWWFSVRTSNTEPLLRLNIEAKTPDVLAARLTELKEAIGA